MFISRNHNSWGPDRYYSGGRYHPVPRNVIGTEDPELYNTERFGNFNYTIPVAQGSYTAILHFSEAYFGPSNYGKGGSGGRVFDVYLNGVVLLKNFDIFKEAGGENRALKKEFRGLRPNALGKLVFTFQPIRNYPCVNAIEIIPSNQYELADLANMTESAYPAVLNLAWTADRLNICRMFASSKFSRRVGVKEAYPANDVLTYISARRQSTDLSDAAFHRLHGIKHVWICRKDYALASLVAASPRCLTPQLPGDGPDCWHSHLPPSCRWSTALRLVYRHRGTGAHRGVGCTGRCNRVGSRVERRPIRHRAAGARDGSHRGVSICNTIHGPPHGGVGGVPNCRRELLCAARGQSRRCRTDGDGYRRRDDRNRCAGKLGGIGDAGYGHSLRAGSRRCRVRDGVAGAGDGSHRGVSICNAIH